MKTTIRRTTDGWTVRRPAFGFAPASSTTYATWEAARDSLHRRIASAPAQATQAGKPVRPTRARRTTNYPLEIQ